MKHCLYRTFFKRESWDVYARTPLEAKELAIAHFKARKNQHSQIAVALMMKVDDETGKGEEVTHTPDF